MVKWIRAETELAHGWGSPIALVWPRPRQDRQPRPTAILKKKKAMADGGRTTVAVRMSWPNSGQPRRAPTLHAPKSKVDTEERSPAP